MMLKQVPGSDTYTPAASPTDGFRACMVRFKPAPVFVSCPDHNKHGHKSYFIVHGPQKEGLVLYTSGCVAQDISFRHLTRSTQ